MYAIEEGMKLINGVVTETFERKIEPGLSLYEVEAGTTGYQSDDTRAYFRITAHAGDFFARVSKESNQVEIAVSGEEGLKAMLDSLLFAMKAMIEQCAGEDE